MHAAHGRPIIVADDDEGLRDVMLEVLTEAGFSVLLAANGQEVLDIVRGGAHPCLVLCDMLMPGPPVDELVVAFSNDDRTRGITVTLMTGSREPPCGAHYDVLTKPFSLEELLQRARAASQLE